LILKFILLPHVSMLMAASSKVNCICYYALIDITKKCMFTFLLINDVFTCNCQIAALFGHVYY